MLTLFAKLPPPPILAAVDLGHRDALVSSTLVLVSVLSSFALGGVTRQGVVLTGFQSLVTVFQSQ